MAETTTVWQLGVDEDFSGEPHWELFSSLAKQMAAEDFDSYFVKEDPPCPKEYRVLRGYVALEYHKAHDGSFKNTREFQNLRMLVKVIEEGKALVYYYGNHTTYMRVLKKLNKR